MRKAFILLPLLLVLLSSFGCASRQALTPDQSMAVLRSQIVEAAKDLEATHLAGLLSDEVYARCTTTIEKAGARYNNILATYRVYGTIATDEREQLIALVASVVNEVRQKGGK